MPIHPNLRKLVKINHLFNGSDFDLKKSLLKNNTKRMLREIKSDLKTRPDALESSQRRNVFTLNVKKKVRLKHFFMLFSYK